MFLWTLSVWLWRPGSENFWICSQSLNIWLVVSFNCSNKRMLLIYEEDLFFPVVELCIILLWFFWISDIYLVIPISIELSKSNIPHFSQKFDPWARHFIDEYSGQSPSWKKKKSFLLVNSTIFTKWKRRNHLF